MPEKILPWVPGVAEEKVCTRSEPELACNQTGVTNHLDTYKLSCGQ